jgi:hypothetical protein
MNQFIACRIAEDDCLAASIGVLLGNRLGFLRLDDSQILQLCCERDEFGAAFALSLSALAAAVGSGVPSLEKSGASMTATTRMPFRRRFTGQRRSWPNFGRCESECSRIRSAMLAEIAALEIGECEA